MSRSAKWIALAVLAVAPLSIAGAAQAQDCSWGYPYTCPSPGDLDVGYGDYGSTPGYEVRYYNEYDPGPAILADMVLGLAIGGIGGGIGSGVVMNSGFAGGGFHHGFHHHFNHHFHHEHFDHHHDRHHGHFHHAHGHDHGHMHHHHDMHVHRHR
jgi:hypothetical protein